MNASGHFRTAGKADSCGSVIFYAVVLVSAALLIFPKPEIEAVAHPLLIVSAMLAIICTVFTTIHQTEGNRALRATQLSDAFGAGVGEPIRQDYYNNVLPRTMRRLAATTLENTFFTKELLSQMATKERVKNGAYFVLLLILLVCRLTPTSWLLVVAQTLFSADLILKWIRLERFRIRASRAYTHLEQFFLQNGDTNRPNDMAVLLGAFTDYECAKDEAVIPLDERIFNKLNPTLSKEWEQEQKRLNIM